jgi:predicted nuclease with TOPRIM domain
MAEDKEYEKKRQQAKKQTQKDVDEISVYVQDTMISVAAKIGETLKESVNDAIDGADASVIKSIGNDLTRQFKSAAKFSDTLASNNAKLNQGILTGKDIEKQQFQLQEKRSALIRKLLHAKKMGVEYSMEDRQQAFEALNIQKEQLNKDKERADGIKKALGATGEVFTRISKNKFFGGLLNAEEGLKKMRSEAAKNGKAFSGLGGKIKLIGKGIGAAFSGIESATIILGVIKLIVKAFKFVLDLALGFQKKVVETAQTFGVAKEQARKMVEEVSKGADASGKLYMNTSAALAAQKELVNLLDRGGKFMADSLTSVTFLQQRLGLSSDTAAKFVSKFEMFGKSSEAGLDNILAMNNSMINAGQSTATFGQVVKGVSEASGQIQASFGFSAKSIARGYLAARKLGLTLSQTKSVSESLLDFESSIAAEMEAELFLGRDIELGKARTLAMQGDMVGATQEVMKTMKGLTKEERKRPFIMKNLAKLSGLSVDELQDAYALEHDRGRQAQQQIKNQREFLKRQKEIKEMVGKTAEEKEELIKKLQDELGIANASRKQLDANVTAGQAFQEVIEKAKNALQKFVGSGALDKLVDLLTDFIDRAAKVGFARAAFGGGDAEIATDNANALLKQQNLSKQAIEKIKETQEVASQGFWSKAWAFTKGAAFGGPTGVMMGSINVARKNAQIKGAQTDLKTQADALPKEAKVEDFTLRPLGKDTITMAGGTKLGGNVEKLLQELINVIKEGGDVYLDGGKVGSALALGARLTN